MPYKCKCPCGCQNSVDCGEEYCWMCIMNDAGISPDYEEED